MLSDNRLAVHNGDFLRIADLQTVRRLHLTGFRGHLDVWVLQQKETPDAESCGEVLDRVLASSQLRRSARLRELLAYVGRRVLEDGCTLIREQEIGIEVFGRLEGYDTSADNIVRVNATELRKRIDAYFETEGSHEPVVMEIPRGNYVPVFRYRPVEPETEVDPQRLMGSQVITAVPAIGLPQALPFPPDTLPSAPRPWTLAAGIAAGLTIAALVAVCLTLWTQNRAMHRLLYSWQSKPSVKAFWSGFLDGNPNTDVVVADASFGLFQTLSKHLYSSQDYFSRSYASQVQTQALSPEMRDALALLARRTFISRGGFTMAQHFAALDPLNNRIHIYLARNYLPSLIMRDNVILFGSRLSNPWDELFEGRLNFTFQHDFNAAEIPGAPHAFVINHAPATGEQAVYAPSGTSAYCTIAYLPNPDHNGRVLIIQGTNSEAAQGCGDFLLSEDGLSGFRKKLNGQGFPSFELLLKTSQVIETPISATLVAYRIYPNLN